MSALVAVGLVAWAVRSGPLAPERAQAGLEAALEHRGLVSVVGEPGALRGIDGLVPREVPSAGPLWAALRADDALAVTGALRRAGARALVVSVAVARRAPATSVLGRFGRFGVVPGFRTLYLDPSWVAVEPYATPAMTLEEREALARVARQMLVGSSPPRLAQFPVSLRVPFPCEVLVMLRRPAGDLALWRSSRASSLASGLLTSVGVARQRWEARTTTLGSSLADESARMQVEVALLVDDGTLGARTRGFLDAAISTAHGVAYDQPSSWRYLLPESDLLPRSARGSSGFRALFRDNQLPDDALRRDDLRLYRVRVEPLSVSPSERR